MHRLLHFFVWFFIFLFISVSLFASDEGLVAWWNFENVDVQRVEVKMVRGETFVPREILVYVKENVSNTTNEIYGKYHKVVPGVKGKAVLLDGYTSYMELDSDNSPRVEDDFSVECWLALGAYPKNWCPIVDNQRVPQSGYFNGYILGIDAMGRLMFSLANGNKIDELYSPEIIPLNTWTHVAGVYTPQEGMKIFINGKLVGTRKLDAAFSPASGRAETSLLVAKSRAMVKPSGVIRPYGTAPSHTFLDAIIDELKIYDRALNATEIKASFAANKSNEKPALPKRILPAGPPGPHKFGAISTTLKYYESWDAPWQLADNADVIVRFDESPCRFVFWHGTNYIPNWVTGNGIWFNNGFDEGWNEHGSCEPMSDKQNRHSFVKIVESNDARVVVQWRYALIDNWNNFAFVDPLTGWGDWVEETYTIYPDMIGVREDILLSNAPRAAHEWQESIMVMGPGQRPDEVLELAALSLANMKGETKTWSWEHETPPHIPPDPPKPNIQVVNTKSKYRPFSAIRPQDNPVMDIYSGEIRRDVCVFPWWNHWPVAPRPTDGRWAMASDRASHASLSHWHWEQYEMEDYSMTKIMLNGMTNKKVEELIPLVKDWSNPPKLTVKGSAYTSSGYDPTEMAFQLTCKQAGKPTKVAFEISASPQSPVINPAFVVKNWGDTAASLQMNGKELEPSKDLRFGYHDTIEGTSLIVWVRFESDKPVKVVLSPVVM